MSEATEFDIGSEVLCGDEVCGDLRRVVIDPVARAITHLVVEPRHRRHGGHLVPVELVSSTGEEIRLSCTIAEFAALDTAEEERFVAGGGGEWGYDETQSMVASPHPTGRRHDGHGRDGNGRHGRVRFGRRHAQGQPGPRTGRRSGDPARRPRGGARRADWPCRRLVVDPRDHHVTHVLLDEGHIWGKKRVAIPIGVVTRLDLGITVDLSKEQIEELPAVELQSPRA